MRTRVAQGRALMGRGPYEHALRDLSAGRGMRLWTYDKRDWLLALQGTFLYFAKNGDIPISR
jgi:hypothetical protein